MKRRALSLPHEHGGYLTIAGGAIAAVALAPRPLYAAVAALALGAAFFARAPIERWTRAGGAARFDGVALATLALLVAGSSAFVLAARGAIAGPALAIAPGLVGASYVVRRRRAHRSAAFEVLGMGALGASAGLMLLAGGAPPRIAAASALVLGVHAAVAVPVVRSELRPAERDRAPRANLAALAAIAACALALSLFAVPRAALALLPRAVHLLASRQRAAHPRPLEVGLRETALLATTIALLVASLRY